MGYASAGGIFDPIAQVLIDHGVSDDVKLLVCDALIGVLQKSDWDTEGESLDQFADDPVIVEAFRRHDIILTCWNEDLSDGHWHECTLERLHPGDHSDGMHSWPRTEGEADERQHYDLP